MFITINFLYFLENSSNLIAQDYSNAGVLSDIHAREGDTHPGIIFNTDGISPFKSSLVTIWPVLIALTNLPPNIRMNQDNLITVAVWAGESKPSMSVLFQSFKLLLEGINEKGISVATHIGNQVIKFRAAFDIFDLVAKAPILNMNQWMPYLFASWCMDCIKVLLT